MNDDDIILYINGVEIGPINPEFYYEGDGNDNCECEEEDVREPDGEA